MNSILRSVPIESIQTQPQVRERINEEEQIAIAVSIEHNGVLVPLLGHREDGEIVLDDGHRRLDAAKRAGLDAVPMIVSDHAPSLAERIQFQLVANAHRVDLGITERARAIQQLMRETDWSASEISTRLGGPSPATISKLLTLLVLPSAVQDLIDEGKLPMSSAYIIATVEDSAERTQLVEEVLSGKITRDRLVKHVKATRSNKARRTRKRVPKAKITFPLGQGRSVSVSASSLTPELVADWLMELAMQAKRESGKGRSLEETVKIITDKYKQNGGAQAESDS